MVSLGSPFDHEGYLIVENARVYTVNEKRPWAEAVAIGGDRILAVVRSNRSTRSETTTRERSMPGKTRAAGLPIRIFIARRVANADPVDLNGQRPLPKCSSESRVRCRPSKAG